MVKQDKAELTLVDVKKPEVEFKKVDADTGEAVKGAMLELSKESSAGSEVIETWTTDGSSHKKVLEAGTYTLTETSAPQGYEKAEQIKFIIGSNGKMYLVSDDGTKTEAAEAVITMKDKQIKHDVTVNKVDADTGDALSGAELEIVYGSGEDGQTVDKWTTDGSGRVISLPAGTYTLIERTAPDGYDTADPITFRVDEEGQVYVIIAGVESVAQEPVITMKDETTPVTPDSDNPKDEFPDSPDSDGNTSVSTPSSDAASSVSPVTGDPGMTSAYAIAIAALAALTILLAGRHIKNS